LLKGLHGKILVNNQEYNGMMAGYEDFYSDAELAALLTYIRNSFNNRSSSIKPENVKEVRKLISKRKSPYTQNEIQ